MGFQRRLRRTMWPQGRFKGSQGVPGKTLEGLSFQESSRKGVSGSLRGVPEDLNSVSRGFQRPTRESDGVPGSFMCTRRSQEYLLEGLRIIVEGFRENSGESRGAKGLYRLA